MNDPTTFTLREAALAISQSQLRAEALVEACLDRIARLQPALNCFIRVTAEAARAEARAADASIKAGRTLGPLVGIPLAHKDMFYRAGEACSCGSKIRTDFVPDHTATVLTRLDAAGAIELGRLNMAEFAMGPTGHNDNFGRCRNPWNLHHITGGSSSGSGAAVAGHLVFGALGSDTGGSVRLPAAACGTVGIKPTLGRVSRYGTMPLSHSLDCIGVLARNVGDCARLLSVIAGADAHDGMSSGHPVSDYERGLDDAADPNALAGVTVGVPDRYYYDGIDHEVAELLAS
ncbi:MAG: amidase, partial [Acidimicrobiales bacterium]